MKQQFSHIVLALTLVAVIAGVFSACKKKVEAPVVSEWMTQQDPINGMEVQYPKGFDGEE